MATNITACQKTIDLTLQMQNRGCNSEALLKWILTHDNDLHVHYVGQSMLPFQRGVHVTMKDGIRTCVHKYCQSHDKCLSQFGIAKCAGINEDQFLGDKKAQAAESAR